MRNRIWLALILTGGASTARGHGFGQRYDLPIPFELYLLGAGGAVVASFLALAWVKPGPERTTGRCGWRLLAPGPLAEALTTGFRILGGGLLLLVVLCGLLGDGDPFKNPAPTLVWVLGWVGLAFVVGLVGNIWPLLNPWLGPYRLCLALWRRLAGRLPTPPLRYPERLAAWPAVALFPVFVWLELIWSRGDDPRALAWLVLTYSLLTWVGMGLFGADTWVRNGELFTRVFAIYGRFAPLFGDRGGLSVRPHALGLLRGRTDNATLALVLMLLASVTFDGLMATPLWLTLFDALLYSQSLRPLVLALQSVTGDAVAAVNTLGMIGFMLLFAGLYLLFSALMGGLLRGLGHPWPWPELSRQFILTLVPIALAYHLAHYLAYLLTVGQYLIPIASDPLGLGWDLFGTRLYRVEIAVLGVETVWYLAVISVVTGHILAVYLAHRKVLELIPERRAAVISQLPMLALMVAYTLVSLWILAQPIVEMT